MNRPDEPVDDQTMAVPADPWPTIDRPPPSGPTTYAGGAAADPSTQPGDTTAYLGRPGHLGDVAGQATAYLGRSDVEPGPPTADQGQGTAYLGRPAAQPGDRPGHLGDVTGRAAADAGNATAYLGQPNASTAYLGQPNAPTAYLGPSGTPPAPPGLPTAHLGQPNVPAAHLGQPNAPTAHLGQPNAPTAHLGQPNVYSGDATARLGDPSGYRGDPGETVGIGTSPWTAPVDPTPLPGGSLPTVRAQNELRFGPGVPATPAATPAWPGAAGTARRRRPLWRRLVSVLSSLLTLALIGVVGFYIWQRLSPLKVEGVTVSVPEPAGTRCDVTVDVVATVRTNGRSGVIRYQWFRSDAPPGAVLTEQVGSGQQTAALTLKWTFTGVGASTETATVNILEPSPLQVGTPVQYNCKA
ncbi:hypothetical protein Q0Z83_055540 [Actinoplanes sichuanensis]|uniref:Ig-like domain-containing protein n=1 Tax=Actinoplanes sichuanensis TaxID=512349 RepID=A0ABW4AQI5_9ACTN|nr:hypothetical protein [Actinoplanes sichuanensis]BEL07363.1 hypothetical protein Q0Z83_055540 [Actinoplanes sichuanensis]